jgi:hypothetical protein
VSFGDGMFCDGSFRDGSFSDLGRLVMGHFVMGRFVMGRFVCESLPTLLGMVLNHTASYDLVLTHPARYST